MMTTKITHQAAISLLALLLLFTSCDESGIQNEAGSTERSEPTSIDTTTFNFIFEGRKYAGVLDLPQGIDVKSLIVLVPGSGKTAAYTGEWNYTLRAVLNKLGVATFAYDKPGCGNSEGEFDYNQTVENSSYELVAAVRALQDQKIPGAHNIGLWGLSRAGWICPLAITKEPDISYWISVSGPNHLDNMFHLLTTNWTIEGKSEEEVNQLGQEWLAGFTIQRAGGSYAEYQKATPSLEQDSFMNKIRGKYNEERFLKFQSYLIDNNVKLDEETGLQIMLEDFDSILHEVTIPVLAIFGENDSQVDWKATLKLYQNSLGNTSLLQTESIPNCNHFIKTCETGGFAETRAVLEAKGLGEICPRYLSIITDWVEKQIEG
ncbi:MAG: alpha/beta hydrolase [Bacteroidota bacterium]